MGQQNKRLVHRRSYEHEPIEQKNVHLEIVLSALFSSNILNFETHTFSMNLINLNIQLT